MNNPQSKRLVQIKTFQENKFEDLEKAVNNWLTEQCNDKGNTGFSTKDIQYHTDRHMMYTAMIVYLVDNPAVGKEAE